MAALETQSEREHPDRTPLPTSSCSVVRSVPVRLKDGSIFLADPYVYHLCLEKMKEYEERSRIQRADEMEFTMEFYKQNPNIKET